MRPQNILMTTVKLEYQILTKIKKARRGSLFFADSFATYGTTKAVAKTLERLTKKGELLRVARGMYTRPVKDPVLGVVLPSIEEIAIAIAKRDKATIVPTGSYALYKLGLTTQVPLNIVYYTSASARTISIGNRIIKFKKASAKNLSAIGEISKLVLQALKSIGKDNVTQEQLTRLMQLMRKEKPFHALHDINLAPAWIRKLLPIRNEIAHG